MRVALGILGALALATAGCGGGSSGGAPTPTDAPSTAAPTAPPATVPNTATAPVVADDQAFLERVSAACTRARSHRPQIVRPKALKGLAGYVRAVLPQVLRMRKVVLREHAPSVALRSGLGYLAQAYGPLLSAYAAAQVPRPTAQQRAAVAAAEDGVTQRALATGLQGCVAPGR